MTKINRSILALVLAMVFCFSAVPAYAAEITTETETASTMSARATIFNVGNYMSGSGYHDVHNFTVTSSGTYTFTVVVDAMGGDGALVVLHKVGASGDIYHGTITGNFQKRYNLPAGNYVLEVSSWDALAYSASIMN